MDFAIAVSLGAGNNFFMMRVRASVYLVECVGVFGARSIVWGKNDNGKLTDCVA